MRVDSGVYSGAEVPVFYDPMIAKLAAWGRDRNEAIERMRRALDEFTIAGELTTNLEFHRWIMRHPRFIAGDFDTNFIKQEYHPENVPEQHDDARMAAILAAAFMAQRNHDNHAAASATMTPAAAVSAWRMLSRLEMLRR
ncbi:MAG: hypothetical protein ACREQ4_01235 [Candidatus Binataceae bacterium]